MKLIAVGWLSFAFVGVASPHFLLASAPQNKPGAAEEKAAPASSPTKWKVEFPRFFIIIDDLADRIRQPNVPICKGSVRLLGEWQPKAKTDAGKESIRIVATFGTNWDGFYIGYELTADAPPGLHGRTRLSVADLKNVKIRYTDDLLEANEANARPVEDLIKLLRKPENKVRLDGYGIVIPGGEMLFFSVPLKALMFRGKEARTALMAQADDLAIRNEVVLALGAVGDETTVKELISRYPRGTIDPKDESAVVTRCCFSWALCWLTGRPIDRSRYGTDLESNNAEKWKHLQFVMSLRGKTIEVSPVKRNATWVPRYPVLPEEEIARIRKLFAERGDDWAFEYE